MISNSSLVLGTAQIGFPYGIANKTGQPSQTVATDIIREAWECGIREFDTAHAYGVSEKVLGIALAQLGLSDQAIVITKLNPIFDHLDAKVMEGALRESIARLGVEKLSGVLLHKEDLLPLWHKGLADIFSGFVAQGLVKKVGISVYSPQKAIDALNTDGIDMVQVPTNLLDNRFEKAGVFSLAREKKKIVYVRSVFLQGLILINPAEIPEHLAFAAGVIEKIESLAHKLKISRKELALGYVKYAVPDARIVLGVDLPSQVRDNCLLWESVKQSSLISQARELFPAVDERILNPAQWIEKK